MDSQKFDWFWSNYKCGMDWIKQHEIAHWKSQALAYRDENSKLLRTLHDVYVQPSSSRARPLRRSITPMSSRKHRKKRRNRTSITSHCHESVNDSEVEVSKELVDFLKISMKHKNEKEKEKELQNAKLSAFLPPQDVMELRQKEMIEIYGEGSAKIMGMETAMTLAFEKFVDQKNPEYWPVIPLNFN